MPASGGHAPDTARARGHIDGDTHGHGHGHGHDHAAAADFTGADPRYLRVLWLVVVLNGLMFAVEMLAGRLAGSMALQADALDFAGDAATYGLSLAVIGTPLATRARAALLKGVSLALMAAFVMGATLWRVFVAGVPEPITMGAVAALALGVNLASVLLLWRWQEGDANVRSVWLCSRNDAIGNVLVAAAALGVFGTGTRWPDLAVAAAMASLFLNSSVQIIRRALAEFGRARSGEAG